MKVVICAGTATSGKTTVLNQLIKRLSTKHKVAYVKVDVQYADEPEEMARKYGIPTKKVYSGDLCPDHCNVIILGEAIKWAAKEKVEILIVETAGLCLRCSPYIDGALGIVVLEATSGMNLPRKIGPMLSLADIAVVTKIDLVSQAEREVFRARIQDASKVNIIEVDALRGVNFDRLAKKIEDYPGFEPGAKLMLRGNPPLGTCTICAGRKEIGKEYHFGVLRPLEQDIFYRGE